MTDFRLSPTEQMLRDTARSYFGDFCDNAYLEALEHSSMGYDEKRWAEIADLGWLSLGAGGPAGDHGTLADAAIVCEEIGRAAYPSPLLQALSVGQVVARLSTTPVADDVGKLLADGGRAVLFAPLGSNGPTVRRAGSRLEVSSHPAVLEWVEGADLLILLLPFEDGSGWCLAHLRPGQFRDGVRSAASIDNERVAVVDLEGLTFSDDDLLGTPQSSSEVEDALAAVRLLRAAELVGGAGRVLDLTSGYMKERKQFGVALGSFQAVQHHLANMAIAVDAARLATYEGLTRELRGDSFQSSASIAGFVAGRSAVQVVTTGAHLHGGIGVTTEYILHHFYRRAKAMQLRLGTRAWQLEQIVQTTLRRPTDGLWQDNH